MAEAEAEGFASAAEVAASGAEAVAAATEAAAAGGALATAGEIALGGGRIDRRPGSRRAHRHGVGHRKRPHRGFLKAGRRRQGHG